MNDIRWAGWGVCVCVRGGGGGGEGSILEVFVQGLEFRIVGKYTACCSG